VKIICSKVSRCFLSNKLIRIHQKIFQLVTEPMLGDSRARTAADTMHRSDYISNF